MRLKIYVIKNDENINKKSLWKNDLSDGIEKIELLGADKFRLTDTQSYATLEWGSLQAQIIERR